MLEDQFNGGLKEVCYPVYTDGNLEIPFSNCSTSRKLIIGCQMIHSLKTLIGSNDLPVMADRCEALDDEHLKMLGKEQMFITQVSMMKNNNYSGGLIKMENVKIHKKQRWLL